MRGLEQVRTECSWTVLAYSRRRVVNRVEMPRRLAALGGDVLGAGWSCGQPQANRAQGGQQYLRMCLGAVWSCGPPLPRKGEAEFPCRRVGAGNRVKPSAEGFDTVWRCT
jgi:hypothetical protein